MEREEYNLANGDFTQNFSNQDAAILNIIRVCEKCIDLGSHIIKINKFGIPNDNKDVFRLLAAKQIISLELSNRLQKMIGYS